MILKIESAVPLEFAGHGCPQSEIIHIVIQFGIGCSVSKSIARYKRCTEADTMWEPIW